MKTNFTFTVDSLKRINGRGSNDLEFAVDATNEMLKFVQEQAQIINEFVELTRVMSSDSERVIDDCLIAINHIYSVLQELEQFFRLSLINDCFDITLYKVKTIKEEVEIVAAKLRVYLNVK